MQYLTAFSRQSPGSTNFYQNCIRGPTIALLYVDTVSGYYKKQSPMSLWFGLQRNTLTLVYYVFLVINSDVYLQEAYTEGCKCVTSY